MIRPEKYQYNWKPKYNSKEDLELIQEIEKIRKKLRIKKSEFLRMALTNLIKYYKANE
jgi:hypothetical protein|tara:strand:+ start:219 stop:392 length:174 start_codon:yes stop_codon:yes gene_type:complete